MLRFRNLAIVVAVAWGIYALAPRERKARLAGKVREFGRALVVSLILFWLLMIGRSCIAG